MRRFLLLSVIAAAACSPEAPKPAVTEAPKPVVEAPKPPTEAEALAVANAIEPLMLAKDAPGIVALYADTAVLVDPMAPELITTKEANLAATKGLVDANVVKVTVHDRKVQVLDADTFVVTMIGSLDTKPPKGKAETMTMRVTDVYQKQADGKWLAVNEHVSAMPVKPKTPLPTLETYPPAPASPAPASPAPASASSTTKPH